AAAIALGRTPVCDVKRGFGRQATQLCRTFAHLNAFRGLAVQLLCHGRGPAHLAERLNDHDEGGIAAAYRHDVAWLDVSRRLGQLAVHLYATLVDLLDSQAARLVKTRGP